MHQLYPRSPDFVALSAVRLTLSLFGVPAVLFEFAHAGAPLTQPQLKIIGGGNYAKVKKKRMLRSDEAR